LLLLRISELLISLPHWCGNNFVTALIGIITLLK
jgi:hypothetical protein